MPCLDCGRGKLTDGLGKQRKVPCSLGHYWGEGEPDFHQTSDKRHWCFICHLKQGENRRKWMWTARISQAREAGSLRVGMRGKHQR